MKKILLLSALITASSATLATTVDEDVNVAAEPVPVEQIVEQSNEEVKPTPKNEMWEAIKRKWTELGAVISEAWEHGDKETAPATTEEVPVESELPSESPEIGTVELKVSAEPADPTQLDIITTDNTEEQPVK